MHPVYAFFLLTVDVCASSTRFRRDDAAVHAYCKRQAFHYQKYCVEEDLSDFNSATQEKLTRFCTTYLGNCKEEMSEEIELIVPPPLPQPDNLQIDYPIQETVEEEFEDLKSNPARVETCTPQCSAPHCTTTCMCAHTHAKVESLCTPPADADVDRRCKAWFETCTMYSPFSY